VLVVTHEHSDHNGVESSGGEPHLVRSTAGTFTTPVGPVLGIASEHDDAAGTLRGPNLIVAFNLHGVRVRHFGDFGQSELRPFETDDLPSRGTPVAVVPRVTPPGQAPPGS
jgi:Beta-lactamase superfamily domain